MIHALLMLTSLAVTVDGGVVAKVKAPVPTEAECIALGSVRSPFSFSAGESLEFDLDALGAKAGKMTMQVLPTRDGLMPIEVHAETNTFFSKVRKVTAMATSYLNPATLRPGRYVEDALENETHRVAEVTFRKNKTAKLVSTIDGRRAEGELRFGNDISDVVGWVYLLRELELKEGRSMCFDVYGIRTIWRVWGKVAPREHVSLPVGEFDAWHLVGEAARLDIPDLRREMHVWISDDARRLPLAAMGGIDLGMVRATLVGVSRPDRPRQKAENKGNLKW